jgi:hypothetical protein
VPYFCSASSAEFKRWFLAAGIVSAHMVDDWAVIGSTSSSARHNIATLESILRCAGFAFSDKRRTGQIEVFLGIQINTIDVRRSFDAVQCKGTICTLETALAAILANHAPNDAEQPMAAKRVDLSNKILTIDSHLAEQVVFSP